MNYSSSTIFSLITLAFLVSLSLPWPATSASSPSSVHNFRVSHVQNRRFLTPQTPKPVVIVEPTSVSHVQVTVFCARDNGVQIRIRSGGHDYEGLSYRSNVTFVILDMFNLRSIKVDVGKEVTHVQAGTGGRFSGGGYRTLMRKYGFSVDNILDAQVVDVNGNILTRATMGEDLFWAIRGGGGASFAVIVEWKIKLVRIQEKVTVFDLPFSLEQGATDVAFKWQQVAPKLHEDLFIRLQPMVVNGTILVHVVGFFLGESERLVPLLDQSFPELNLKNADCNETSWIGTFLPPGTPPEALLNRTRGARDFSKNKSDYVKSVISKEGIETIWKLLIELGNTTSATVIMQWNPYGGKMGEIPASNTPFSHRSGYLFLVQYIVSWAEGDINVTNHNIERVRYMYKRMAPFLSKDLREAFLNYRDIDIGSTASDETNFRDAQVYGSKYFRDNFPRLTRVKAKASRREQWNRREQGRSRRTAVQRRSGFTLFVDNISKRIHHSSLGVAFQTYGKVEDVYIAYKNMKRRSKRTTFAFVRFRKAEDAERTVVEANGRFMDGHRIRVFFAREKTFHQTGGEKKTQRLTYMNVSRRDARSYKDVLVGKKRLVQGENMGDAVRPHQENDRRCLNEGKAEILVMDDLTKKTIYIPKEAVRKIKIRIEEFEEDRCFIDETRRGGSFEDLKRRASVATPSIDEQPSWQNSEIRAKDLNCVGNNGIFSFQKGGNVISGLNLGPIFSKHGCIPNTGPNGRQVEERDVSHKLRLLDVPIDAADDQALFFNGAEASRSDSKTKRAKRGGWEDK
ncbi:hypothetical protein V6N12_017805 [Hibiscus sabdariffa]|uniref:Uncharacterized protein n=1 Tax=Hibiscus sabdariffa TaxID=183260 RepID=A0ABR2BBQ2_9ROSI